jgi:hypothetical protein
MALRRDGLRAGARRDIAETLTNMEAIFVITWLKYDNSWSKLLMDPKKNEVSFKHALMSVLLRRLDPRPAAITAEIVHLWRAMQKSAVGISLK